MRYLRPLTALLALAAGALVAACSMVGTTPIIEATGFRCASNAGAYFLPKTELVLQVDRSGAAPPNFVYNLTLQYRRVPDTRFGFCLDYLARASSDDIVDVKTYPGTQLLGFVSTDALDQTRYILQTLIRAAFVIASGDPDFPTYGRDFSYGAGGTSTTKTVFKGDLDPFDAERTAQMNQTLREFGFCLVLPPYSYSQRDAPINSYCEHPKRVLEKVGAPGLGYTHITNEALLRKGRRRGEGGIFYRPRMPYPIHVYLRENPLVPRWRLGIARVIEMENIAPVVSVGVERTLFTQRKTTLVFDEGALSDVCIYKASELLSAVNIPLQVVQSIVALPTEVIQVKINNTDNQKQLVMAEDQLIKTQTSYLQFLNDPAQASYTGSTPTGHATDLKGLGTATSPTGKILPYHQLARPTTGNPNDAGKGIVGASVCPTAAVDTTVSGLKFQPIFKTP